MNQPTDNELWLTPSAEAVEAMRKADSGGMISYRGMLTAALRIEVPRVLRMVAENVDDPVIYSGAASELRALADRLEQEGR